MTKSQIKLKDFLNFKAISQIKASPNKEQFAFVLATPNEKENNYERVIYVSDGTNFKQMTALKKESNFVWQDDNHLLFATKRFKSEEESTDNTYIYRLALDGGEAQCVYEINIPVNQFWVLDDNTLLLSSTYHTEHPNFYQYSKTKREKVAKEKKENSDWHELSQIPFWFNGTQYIDQVRTRLFLYDTSEKTLKPITQAGLDIGSVVVNRDKTKVYYTSQSYKTRRPQKSRLYEYDVQTKETQALISTNKYAVRSVVPLKGQLLVLATDNKRLGLNQNTALYQLDGPNQLDLLIDDIDLGNSIGSDVRLGASSPILIEDDYFIYNTTVDGHSELIKFKDNQTEVIFSHEGAVDGFVLNQEQLIVMGLFNQQLQDFYDKDLNRLSTFNTSLDDKYLSIPQKIVFESNNSDISGWVLLPKDYDQQTQLKAILDIHGGPKTAYGEVYYHEMQVWANMGYVVMYCNPHGSSGKGDEFSDIRGKYGTIDYEDIMTFVDKVLQQYPKINPDKIGVTGGSYGGFMTNWIIGHTNRFACAVTQRSISNWLSFNGVSDIGYYFAEDQNAATLYSKEGQEKLWFHSPLKYAANFSTPTLVVHSTDDYRCPIDQGYQLYSALIDRQVDTKMLILKDENHDLSRSGKPKARIKRLTEMTQWFDKYLSK